MGTLLIKIIFVGNLAVTSYQSVPSQTDKTPYHTSIGYRTNKLGVAVSPDLLCPASKYCRRNVRLFCQPSKLHYGDALYIKELGFKQVFDTMNTRHKNAFDVWVGSQEEEANFHRRFKGRKLKVWRVKNPYEQETIN